jgi:LPXTG-motif cell wall-anchored protein
VPELASTGINPAGGILTAVVPLFAGLGVVLVLSRRRRA